MKKQKERQNMCSQKKIRQIEEAVDNNKNGKQREDKRQDLKTDKKETTAKGLEDNWKNKTKNEK